MARQHCSTLFVVQTQWRHYPKCVVLSLQSITAQSYHFHSTPGHSIFLKMRSNSVIVADAVVLVIDIIEGVQTQTIEVIRKCKQASIPLLLALNKIDKILDCADDVNSENEITENGMRKLSEIIHKINTDLNTDLAFECVPK